MDKVKIRVIYDPTDLNSRAYDYRAIESTYEVGDRIGWGVSEQEAIDDLIDQLEVRSISKVEVMK